MAASHLRKPLHVLVTGAAGFVGTALCSRLASAGNPVRGAGRAGRPGTVGEAIEWAAVGEIGPDTDWARALDSVDAIVHLAGRAHVLKELEADPLAAYRRVNVAGTRRLAEAAAHRGVRRLVFVSSIGVNGSMTRAAPFTPDDEPAPHNAYARSKLEAEIALREVASTTGLEVVAVRPPLVYGPCVKANFLRLLHAVHRGTPLPLAAVRNQRSLIGLDNLTSFLECAVAHPAAAGQTFLVADDEPLSTPDLIRCLAHLMRRRLRLFGVPVAVLRVLAGIAGYGKAVEQLCESLLVDSSKAQRLLGWRPPVPVAEGLRRTVTWYREQFGGGR